MRLFSTLCFYFFLVTIVLSSCNSRSSREESISEKEDVQGKNLGPLFILLPPQKTNIDFENTIKEGLNTNVMMYEYFYNGGGVAVGDVSGDGLDDIYFTANMASNRLYLNKGNFVFEDVTSMAKVAGREGHWKTGVTMADVNGDGMLDIYVCYSGNLTPEKRVNELYINQGVDDKGIPHFLEEADKYGLASPANSTQAVFFDYDRDGDIDMFLLNHNPQSLPVLDEAITADILKEENPMVGVRLFRNDNKYFTDVTSKAGLSSSSLTYGLGAGVADINGDGWSDIYICNDYDIPDFFYVNNKNGTFSNQLSQSFVHTSHFSMGNDIADINNDGLPDLYVLDMLPEDNRRQKLLVAPDNYEKFEFNINVGFHYQYMRNMLHVNNGDGNFSEIGQLAGISNTDWSWAPLLADFDNDGWKDLYITNGYLRDYTNMDFIKYMGEKLRILKGQGSVLRKDVLEMVYAMPSSNVVNYMFKNEGNTKFSNVVNEWGMNTPSNSNGAAYADLDNDGDLDLIVNNINQPAFIYKNESEKLNGNKYLKVKLQGEGKNTQGIGAKVKIYAKGNLQYLEQMPTRGYQSSISPILHFGLNNIERIDSLVVVWPGAKSQILKGVKSNHLLILNEKDADKKFKPDAKPMPIFKEAKSSIKFAHARNDINDFKRQPLMVNPASFSGPCLIKGDVNGDGLEDVFVGGATGQAGMVYLQQKNGDFLPKAQPAFDNDKMAEDIDAVFVDINKDGYPDLYICSGGYHNFSADDKLLQDRMYLNDGKGFFTRSTEALPQMLTSSGCVRVSDINSDGSPDLFVGGRVIPGQYPVTPQSYILINDGNGKYSDQTATIAPELQKIGMVTDAVWADINNDQTEELVVVGEWMPVTVFVNDGKKLSNKTNLFFDKSYNGFWNKITTGDFDKNGKLDLIIGNYGLNSQCKVSDKEPGELYFKDFDDNGSVEPIFCFYIQGKSYPYVTRDELLDQLSVMRSRFPNYKSYADATLKDIFTEEELKDVNHLQVNYLETAYFSLGKDNKFTLKQLPVEVQSSPVFAMGVVDFNTDGNDDLLIGGNINNARLRFGNSDANYGILLEGDGKGNFRYVTQNKSGFQIRGDVRSIISINNQVLFGINQKEVKSYTAIK